MVSWSVNPTVTHSKIHDTGYISGGQYYGEGSFAYKIGVIGTGWGAQLGTVEIRVRGDQSGKKSGSFWTAAGPN
ncbi:hypothetical protein [Alkalihalobacillus trypoxylicola]|uniref:Uncharacterized protein n=1 Tax=Alkalihalobacillus trypoxylicola TaxID=519424 RepID=A0A161PGM4_9BACI|nr:hypothetical protein [Alkalihalobacillus trypoxylicola]KYG31934.1 hypothetical protein AZF04_03930 [Alkalihalobacillus trypoxylicola]